MHRQRKGLILLGNKQAEVREFSFPDPGPGIVHKVGHGVSHFQSGDRWTSNGTCGYVRQCDETIDLTTLLLTCPFSARLQGAGLEP